MKLKQSTGKVLAKPAILYEFRVCCDYFGMGNESDAFMYPAVISCLQNIHILIFLSVRFSVSLKKMPPFVNGTTYLTQSYDIKSEWIRKNFVTTEFTHYK